MKPFKFTLESALRWRRTVLTAEQEKLQRLFVTHRRIEAELRTVEAAQRGAVRTQLESHNNCGADFKSVAAYLIGLQAKHGQLKLALQQSASNVERQQTICLNADRDVQLLEKLREKRHVAWQRDADLALETLASESYLARFARRHN